MTTLDRVKRIVQDHLGDEVVDENSKFIDDLGCDSLDIVEIIIAVEKEFETEISDDDAAKIDIVRDLIRLVDRSPLPTSSWDSSRGPQMSNVVGKTIFKYQMPVLEKFTMELPKSAEIIRVADEGGMFWLWAVVDTRAPAETRHFRAFKTGAPIPDDVCLRYVGFCAIFVQMELGLYIFEECM